MQRMHVMLRVKDLNGSLRFYSELFGSEPTVKKPDYAKWMLEDPRLNFSIATKHDQEGDVGIEHLGIQAESPEELEILRERIGRAGGTVNNEGQTTCCYANSDKTWVVDAQGVSWEAFYTSGAAATYYAPPSAAEDAADACCDDTCCDGAARANTRSEVACCEAPA